MLVTSRLSRLRLCREGFERRQNRKQPNLQNELLLSAYSRRSQNRVAIAVVTANGPSSSDQGEQSLHQLAVWPGQRFEDREMVGPVDWQQIPRQPAPDPGLGVVNRLAA